MKLIGKLRRSPALGVGLTALAVWMTAGLALMHAAQPSVQALAAGQWTGTPPPNSPLTGFLPLDVKFSEQYAYVALGYEGLAVVDVSNPTNFVRIGGYDTIGYAVAVAVAGNYAYIADFYYGLFVIDVSNPTNCVLLGNIETSGEAYGLAVAGNYAYVADNEGFHVIDVSNPANCIETGGYGGNAKGVAVRGNYAYVADRDGLQVIDVSNPTNCVRVGGYNASGSASGVAVAGNYAYAAGFHEGLHVIDMSNPTNCVRIGGYDTSGIARAVAVSGTASGIYAYVADSEAGLQVIDVTEPTNCVRVGGYVTRTLALGVEAVAGRAYLVESSGRLTVLPTIPNVQFTLRVEAETNQPFTLEAATDLSGAGNWSPLVTTNVPAMPFDFVDFNVRIAEKPQKFYRVRQP